MVGKYVFVFGAQRTGSTLLLDLFKMHPDIDCTPNDVNLLRFGEGLSKSLDRRQATKLKRWKMEAMGDALDLFIEGGATGILKTVLTWYFDGSNAKYRLHKTPKGEFDLEVYRKLFSEPYFIYTVRNPLGIMASRKFWSQSHKGAWTDIRPGKFDPTVEDTLKYIRIQFDRVLESIVVIDEVYEKAETIGVVVYEDLVKTPAASLIPITSKMGIPLDPILEGIPNLKKPYSSFKINRKKKGLFDSSIGQWKKSLTALEVEWLYKRFVRFCEEYTFKTAEVRKIADRYLIQMKHGWSEVR